MFPISSFPFTLSREGKDACGLDWTMRHGDHDVVDEKKNDPNSSHRKRKVHPFFCIVNH